MVGDLGRRGVLQNLIAGPAGSGPDEATPSSTRDKQSAVEIGRNVERIFAYGIRNKLRDTDLRPDYPAVSGNRKTAKTRSTSSTAWSAA